MDTAENFTLRSILVMNVWRSSGQDQKKLYIALEMFDVYCNPRKSTTVQRKMFYERNLGEREKFRNKRV